VTEFCDGGDLATKLKKQGKFTEQFVQEIMVGIVQAYKLMKSKGNL
jgi:serine/threonine protein kinase